MLLILNVLLIFIFVDINECTDSSVNNCNEDCENTVGSFFCKCNGGKVIDSDGISCKGELVSMVPQYGPSTMLTISGGQILNHEFSLKFEYKWACKSKEFWGNLNKMLNSCTKKVNFDWFGHIYIQYVSSHSFRADSLFKLYFFLHCLKASFVPCPEYKLMVPHFTVRDNLQANVSATVHLFGGDSSHTPFFD